MLPIVIIGGLSFPANSFDAWRKDPVEEAGEWPQMGPIFRGVPSGALATVADVLDATVALDGLPSFLEIDAVKGEVAGFFLPPVTARLQEDVGVALRGAGKHGVTGWIAFVLISEQAACLVKVGQAEAEAQGASGKKPRKKKKKDPVDTGIEWMPVKALFADAARAGAFVSVMDFVKQWQAKQTLTRAAYLANERSLGLLPLAEQPEHAKLLEAVSARVADVHAALASANVKDSRDASLAARYPDVKSLGAALKAAEAPVRAAAVELLALVDPVAAEPFAIALLDDPSRQARRHAVQALGRMKTASSFDALLRVDTVKLEREDTFAPGAIATAVKNHAYEEAAKHALSLFEGKTLHHDAFAALDRTANAAERKALGTRAWHELSFIAGRNGALCVPQLLALFGDHPAEETRVAAAKVLATIGGPDVEKRSQEITMTNHGMGRALNQDDARRRELLGIGKKVKDSGGILKFHGLGLAKLETLIREGFIHPQARQNEAPSTSEFLQLLREMPEALVNGYAVSHARPDYRVHLEAITCDLAKVPKERQEGVRQTFKQLSQRANEVEIDTDDLRIWWT